MEAGLDLFTGGGDSSNGSLSTVSKAEVVEQDFVGLSSEVSSCSAGEAELDLGLGLSLGGGGGGGVKVKPCAWGEYGRILTAKDFPSIMSAASSSSSSAGRVTTNPSPAPVAGTKRAADSSITQEGGSTHGVSQVVGWPPIRAYRINSLVNQSKVQAIEGDNKAIESAKNKDNMKKEIDNNNNNNINGNAQEKGHLGKSLFVKANMDGIPIGRKVDLSVHASYESLSQALENMFVSSNSTTNSFRSTESKGHTDEGTKASKLFDGSSEFVLTYEDKDGDWMLVGDVPWRMFLNTVKRLRIMRSSDANGLAPRFHQNGVRQRNKLS